MWRPSVRNEGSFTFHVDAEKGLSFTYNGSLTCVACAVIVSRKMNDKWLRSTAYLTYAFAEEYSLGQCIDAAQSGSNSQIYAADEAYLNNAGQSLTPNPSPTGEGSGNTGGNTGGNSGGGTGTITPSGGGNTGGNSGGDNGGGNGGGGFESEGD